jgi:hypothetical protein
LDSSVYLGIVRVSFPRGCTRLYQQAVAPNFEDGMAKQKAALPKKRNEHLHSGPRHTSWLQGMAKVG